MRLLNRLKNGTLAVGFYPSARSFQRGIENFHGIQARKLIAYLEQNENTVFGKEHGFSSLRCIEAFQKQIPVRSYEAFRPYIERIAEGEPAVLTRERVLLFEPTGGTTHGSKWIPYTRTLKREFQVAAHTWIADLYRSLPGLSDTKSYWSMTPTSQAKRYTKARIPVGFEDDADYLGLFGRILQSVFAVPPQVKALRDLENFRHVTSYFLLAARDLGIVSVWNPTFFMLLLDYMNKHLDRLLRDLHDGRIRCPADFEEAPPLGRLSPAPARAREVETVLGRNAKGGFSGLWKMLKLVSCWADGISAVHARRLAEMLPGVILQPKGLLATEAIVSFPLAKAGGAVPAYSSHFIEFLPEGDDQPKLMHQLETGGVYTVLVTTGGGLYRYNLGDKVHVTGTYRGLPVIRFHGREHVSDLVGEKLHEDHVQRILERALEDHGIDYQFILFAPETNPCGGHYRLFLETDALLTPGKVRTLARSVDQGLMKNFHYQYARNLGQLTEPQVLPLGKDVGQRAYLRRCTELGQRLGDIKQRVLDPRTGWTKVFSSEGAFSEAL